jgi:hypothetical protein
LVKTTERFFLRVLKLIREIFIITFSGETAKQDYTSSVFKNYETAPQNQKAPEAFQWLREPGVAYSLKKSKRHVLTFH